MDKHNRDQKKEEKKAVNKNPQHTPAKGSGDKAKSKKS